MSEHQQKHADEVLEAFEDTPRLYDFRGTRIKVGSLVVYGGSHADVTEARVEAINAEPYEIKVKPIRMNANHRPENPSGTAKRDYRRSTLTRLNNIVVIG